MISVVIPYMHSKERLPLLAATIKALSKELETCVLEIGRERYLTRATGCFGKKYKYKFIKYNLDIFHRGWALNVGARELSTGNKLIFLDADIIVSHNWLEEVKECDYPAVAWGQMNYLTEESTQRFLNNDFLKYMSYEKVKVPALLGPAGGITVIDRKLFYEIKGFPENFEGTWGGEDNVLFSKLKIFGYPFRNLRASVLHLYHSKSTPRNMDILLFAREMLRWSKKEWDIELKKIDDDWGKT